MKFINKYSHFIRVLIISVALTLIFLGQICDLMRKISGDIEYSSNSFRIGYLAIVLIFLIYACISICRRFIPNIKITFLISYLTITYLFLRFFVNGYILFIPIYNQFYYADIIIVISLLHFLNLLLLEAKYFFKARKNKSFFLEDNLFKDEEIDNEKVLKKLIDVLTNFKPDIAFSIGINAVWGYGKSSFLHRFKSQYEKKNKKGIIFWNRIWKNKGSVAIIENFFEELKDNLKPYSGEISEDINKYVDSILSLSNSDLKKIVNTGKEALSGNETLEKFYDNINDNIKKIDRQIVILLDDLDRLEKPEILNALKLIRTLSDFNNVIFIAGYDRKYIVDTIEMPKDNYLDKIFNVEINLLPFDEKLIIDELLRQVDIAFPVRTGETDLLGFNNAFKNLFSENQISSDINVEAFANNFKCSNYVLKYQDFLKTYRDVKRFINEFKFNASFLDSEYDVIAEEYIVLKLLTYKYRDLPNNIFSSINLILSKGIIDNANLVSQHFGGNANNIFLYDKPAQEKVYKILQNYKDEDKEIINATLCFLFGKKITTFYQERQNSISKMYYTDIYIKNNIAGGQISITQLQNAFEKNQLFEIVNEFSNSPSQYNFQITNELKQFIFNNESYTTEQFVDVLKTLNFIMRYVDNYNDNQSVINLISKGFYWFYKEENKRDFIDEFQDIIGTYVGYLDNLLSSINVNLKREESVSEYNNGILHYDNIILNVQDLKLLFITKLMRAINANMPLEVIFSIYNLHVEIILAEKKILRSREANKIIRDDIEARFYDYIDSPFFISISEYIDENEGELIGYKPNFLLAHIFSNPDTLDLLIKNPNDIELFERFEQEGWKNLRKFLRAIYVEELFEDKIDRDVLKKMTEFINAYIANNYVALDRKQYDKIWQDKFLF